jgi:parallel beta-helix repeat protein
MKSQASLVSLCLILAMGSLIPIMSSAAASTTAQTILSSQGTIVHPQQPCSYIIYQQSSTYYAENGISGQICWSSTRPETVIQNAASNTPYGGSVVVSAGNYNGITTTITPNANTQILTTGAKLSTTANIPIFTVSNQNVTIQGFQLSGNATGSSQVGIYISSNNNNIYENTLSNFGSSGILVLSNGNNIENNVLNYNNGHNIDIKGGSQNTIQDNVITYSNYNVYGIEIQGIYEDAIGNIITDNQINGMGTGGCGIILQTYSANVYSNIVSDNWLSNFSIIASQAKADGIYQEATAGLNCTGNTITGNHIQYANIGISSENLAGDYTVSNNWISNTNEWGILASDGNNITIEDNHINSVNGLENGVSSYAGGISLQSNNSIVTGNIVTLSVARGIDVYHVKNDIISDNSATSTTAGCGFNIDTALNCTFENNICDNNQWLGFGIANTADCSFINNEASGNGGNQIYMGDGGNGLNYFSENNILGTLDLQGTYTWDAQCASVTVGQNVAAGDVLFYNSTGYFDANAVSSATLPTEGVFGIATEAVSSGEVCTVVTAGQFNLPTWTWNVNLPLYVSNSTAGGMMQTYPSGSGEQSEIVAQALSATTILFNPKSVIGE